MVLYLPYIKYRDRQYWANRVDSDRGIWSGSTLFATYLAVLGKSRDIKMKIPDKYRRKLKSPNL